MSDINVQPEIIINDLLDQIKKLTLDNTILRAYIFNLESDQKQNIKSQAKTKETL